MAAKMPKPGQLYRHPDGLREVLRVRHDDSAIKYRCLCCGKDGWLPMAWWLEWAEDAEFIDDGDEKRSSV